MNTRLYAKEPAKSKILHRLKIAQGHLEKIIKMVDKDAYCIDVIHQSQAVQAALKGVDEVVLHNHLYGCVLGGHKGMPENDKLVQEIMGVFQRSEK